MTVATSPRLRDQFRVQADLPGSTLHPRSVIEGWFKVTTGSNPLAQLVRDTMLANGWTYADLAKACDLPRATVYALATKSEQRTTNRPVTLEKLAKGLGLPLSTVRAAAAAGAGYGAETVGADLTPTEVQLLTELASELSPAKRRQLLNLAQMFRDEDVPKQRRSRR